MKNTALYMLVGISALVAACGSDDNTNTTTTGSSTGGSPNTGGGGNATSSGGEGGEAAGGAPTGGMGGQGGQGGEGGQPPVSVEAPLLVWGTGCGSQTDATLNWLDRSDNETEFLIERAPAGTTTFTQVGTAAADATTFTDTTASGGTYVYRVIAVAGEAQGISNERIVALAVPAQTATLEIDPTTLAITITSQPSHFTLSASDPATWAGVGTDLTLSLAVENSGMERLVFNPKVLIDSVSDSGTVVGDGQYDAKPYVYYGPNAMDVAGSVTRDIVISNLAAPAANIAVSVSIVDAPMLFGPPDETDDDFNFLDSSGTGQVGSVDVSMWGSAGRGGSNGSDHGNPYATISADGRRLYLSNRHQPVVEVVDTVTMVSMISPDLTGANNLRFDGSGLGSGGSVRGVTLSPDGQHLYVTMATHTSAYGAGSSTAIAVNHLDEPIGAFEVMRLDADTLEVLDKLVLLDGVAGAHIGRIQLSADGTRGVVRTRHDGVSNSYTPDTTHGRFFLLDMETLSIIDGDPAAGDQQASFDLSSLGYNVKSVSLSPDGTKAYVGMEADAVAGYTLHEVDLATAAVSELTPATPPTSSTLYDQHTGPDGRIYWAMDQDTVIYDPSDQSWVQFTGLDHRGTAFQESSCSWFVLGDANASIYRFDLSDDSAIANPADGGASFSNAAIDKSHAHAVSPF